MKMSTRAAALAAVLIAAGIPAAAQPSTGRGDVKKAKAYLREVKRHLLESYIDRERMRESALVAAGVKGMVQGLDHKDFARVDEAARAAVKDALKEADTLDEALAAADEKAPDLDLVRLADHAAQAMVRETGDPFSRILTDQDMAKLLKSLQGGGKEDSAGCAIELRGGKAAVAYVQYGTPAYEEGVEIGDEVLEIGGRKVEDLKSEDLGDVLRIPSGRPLDFKVRRHGRDYEFRLAARKSAVPDVRYQYLGQGIGYLRLTIFDLSLVKQVRQALKEMTARGMKGVILDLRHNPGGALPAATGVADLFLPQGLMITRTVSHYKPSLGGLKLPGVGGDMDFKTKVPSDYEDLPMVCLVNGGSASASELLAGALKDHKRAVLIGSRTYGKGVGQTPILLNSMFMQRYLYLTVMRYTTPNGTDVDHKGVEPDVDFAEDRPSADRFDAAWTLRRSGSLEKYLDGHWGPGLKKLAERDAFETSGYPEFDAFARGLKTTLEPDQVREELRRAARRRMAQEGTTWVCDLQTDKVLQRGLVEIVDLLEKKE